MALEPMNPYERRIIHSVLQAEKEVMTRSEGEEPYRHVVVCPVKKKRYGSKVNLKDRQEEIPGEELTENAAVIAAAAEAAEIAGAEVMAEAPEAAEIAEVVTEVTEAAEITETVEFTEAPSAAAEEHFPVTGAAEAAAEAPAAEAAPAAESAGGAEVSGEAAE